MRLSTICILGTLGVICLLVSDNPAESAVMWTNCPAGKSGGYSWQIKPGCYKCTCDDNAKWAGCSGCGSVHAGLGTRVVKGDMSLPQPDCCDSLESDPDYVPIP